MTCIYCSNEIGNEVYCRHCGKFQYPIYYTPIEEVRKRLAASIVMIIIIAFFVWLTFGCATKRDIEQDKMMYQRGLATYRTSVLIYNEEMNKDININEVDSIYYQYLSVNQ